MFLDQLRVDGVGHGDRLGAPEQFAHLGDVGQQQGHGVVAPYSLANQQIRDLVDASEQIPVGDRARGPKVTVGGKDMERRGVTEALGTAGHQVVRT